MIYIKNLVRAYRGRVLLTLVLVLASCAVLSFAVSDFLRDSEGLSDAFIIGVMQVLFLVQYVLVRLLWGDVILDVENDFTFNYLTSRSKEKKLVSYKMNALFLIYALHLTLANFCFLIMNQGISGYPIFIATELLGLVISLLLYSFDFMVRNNIAKVFREIYMTIIFVSLLGVYWYPSYVLLYFIIFLFMAGAVVNNIVIRRNYDAKDY
jgi:hypothetical protein